MCTECAQRAAASSGGDNRRVSEDAASAGTGRGRQRQPQASTHSKALAQLCTHIADAHELSPATKGVIGNGVLNKTARPTRGSGRTSAKKEMSVVGSRPFSAAAIMGAASMANAEPSAMAACRCPTAQGRRRGHHLEAEQRPWGRRSRAAAAAAAANGPRPSMHASAARSWLRSTACWALSAPARTGRVAARRRGLLRARQRRPSCQEERGGSNMQPASGDCGGRLNR